MHGEPRAARLPDASPMSARRERGVALILVLWASILLAVIASSFIYDRRAEAMIMANSVSMARARSAADAGIQRAVFDAYRGDNAPDIWKRDGSPHDWQFDGVPVRVVMRDESAKIDVNAASDALLRGLFVSAGLNDDEANGLLDAVLDWRDADSLKHLHGAEEADYKAAGLAYGPANAPFQAIEELQLVLGMRPEIYRRIAPSITVYSRQPGVNAQVASREVLLAIPGATADVVDDYIARREAARANGEPPPAFPQAGAFATGNAMVLSIVAEAKLDDGTFFSREAVALLRPVPRKPVTFVVWRESTAMPASPADAAAAEAAR
jgi:general secretion pathway protein K